MSDNSKDNKSKVTPEQARKLMDAICSLPGDGPSTEGEAISIRTAKGRVKRERIDNVARILRKPPKDEMADVIDISDPKLFRFTTLDVFDEE